MSAQALNSGAPACSVYEAEGERPHLDLWRGKGTENYGRKLEGSQGRAAENE